MKAWRWMVRPDLFSDVLERVNVPHHSQFKFLKELTAKMRLSYPMVSYFNLLVDHRQDKTYEMNRLEQELMRCYY